MGEPVVIEGPSPTPPFVAVFEDDGDTGYFYALDASQTGNPILDALHIYNARDVSDRHLPSEAQIVWSEDGRKVVLLINDHPHAVFDFTARRGCCRSGFPPPAENAEWSREGHEWDEAALKWFV